MEMELKQLRDMISSLPSVIKPIPNVSAVSHRVSIFAPPICDVEVPKRFQLENLKIYDGITNLEECDAHYREHIEIFPIMQHLNEAFLCKGFGSTLIGSTLKWF